MLGDQSSQESFDQKLAETNKEDVQNENHEYQNTLQGTAKSDVHFEMLQLETSSQLQPQTTDTNFVTHN